MENAYAFFIKLAGLGLVMFFLLWIVLCIYYIERDTP